MDEWNKFLGGGIISQLNSPINSAISVWELSNPLKYHNWIQNNEGTIFNKAVTSSSLQLWESLTKTSQVYGDKNILSTITNGSNWLNDSHKANLLRDSLASLSGKINWQSLEKSYNGLNNFNWIQTLHSGAFQKLDKTSIVTDWHKPFQNWYNFEHQQPVGKSESKVDIIEEEIARFADNVSAIYSQVENLDEYQTIAFASNVGEILTHEVNENSSVYQSVLEWILQKYNELMESALLNKNLEALQEIYAKLKNTTIVFLDSLL